MRRRPSFGLICAVTAIVVIAAVFFYAWVQEMQRRSLTAEISKKALVMGYLESVVFDPQANPEVVSDVLSQLVVYRCPTNGLFLNDRVLDARSVENIGKMTWLQSLVLARTNITDDDLIGFSKMRKLHTLVLTDTKVSDVGLASLRSLSQLRLIGVCGTSVSEEGLLQLKKALPNLQVEYEIECIRRHGKPLDNLEPK